MALAYVALGDSYAAGVGGGPEVNACWRAEIGYPVQVAARLGVDLAYQACVGAVVADVIANQLGPLGPDTAYVSITIGGNDIGFTPVLIACAEPGWMSDSDAAIDRAVTTLREQLPGRLDDLYARVRSRAPEAKVIVTTYPRLFNGEDCNLATFFSAHEMTRLNATADELAGVIAAAADRAGFGVVDVIPEFIGHAVCDHPEWLNGVEIPLQGSYHPNQLGHTAYADEVAPAFGAEAVAPPVREPSVVQGRCVPGSAPTFALPDLLSGRSLAGAARFGLDPDEIADLARRTQHTARPDESAQLRLHELDAIAELRRGRRRG